MWSPKSYILALCYFSPSVSSSLFHWKRAACGVSSAYSVLSSTRTGSAFCSSLLYPNGGSATTVTVLTTSTKPCKTVTATATETSVKTVYKTEETTLPEQTVKVFSSTVLVPSGTHRPVGKRAPQADAPTASTATTAQAATPAAAAAGYQCAPTPSQLCSCPAATIRAACSSLVPTPKPRTSTINSTVTTKCPKETITVTTTDKTKVISTTTFTVYPGPVIISKTSTKVLTKTVPYACAQSAYNAVGGNGIGNEVTLLAYPDFPQTPVECCVLCYNSKRFPNCVASAYLSGSATCELLIKVNATEGAPTNAQCSLGVEDYPFGQPALDGIVFPGPCGY